MLESVEVRWFGRGEPPPALTDWFTRAVLHAEQQPVRVDHYLRGSGSDALGIKLREGRLEIKRRVASAGLRELAAGCAGYVETWRKWAFLLAPEAQAFESPESGSWASVTKSRHIGRFVLSAAGQPVPAALDALLPAACDCELTAVALGRSEPWWTLGFEAFGPALSALGLLLAVAHQLLRMALALSLTEEMSQSYPAWLTAIGAHGPYRE